MFIFKHCLMFHFVLLNNYALFHNIYKSKTVPLSSRSIFFNFVLAFCLLITLSNRIPLFLLVDHRNSSRIFFFVVSCNFWFWFECVYLKVASHCAALSEGRNQTSLPVKIMISYSRTETKQSWNKNQLKIKKILKSTMSNKLGEDTNQEKTSNR